MLRDAPLRGRSPARSATLERHAFRLGAPVRCHRPAGGRPDAARPAMRGVRRGPVPQAQPVDRSRHGARLPAAGARTGRGQGGIAGRQRGADLARQAHLSQRPALRDAFRLPARRPAPAALLLRPAGIGDARRPDARHPRRNACARAADRRHADLAARPGALGRAPSRRARPCRQAPSGCAGWCATWAAACSCCRATARRSPWRTARRSRNSPARCAS